MTMPNVITIRIEVTVTVSLCFTVTTTVSIVVSRMSRSVATNEVYACILISYNCIHTYTYGTVVSVHMIRTVVRSNIRTVTQSSVWFRRTPLFAFPAMSRLCRLQPGGST